MSSALAGRFKGVCFPRKRWHGVPSGSVFIFVGVIKSTASIERALLIGEHVIPETSGVFGAIAKERFNPDKQNILKNVMQGYQYLMSLSGGMDFIGAYACEQYAKHTLNSYNTDYTLARLWGHRAATPAVRKIALSARNLDSAS